MTLRTATRRCAALLAFARVLVLPALAAQSELDQTSPNAASWMYCYEPVNVWQQQVRVGIGGVLDAFEVTVVGPVGAQVELRLRTGDGWSDGPMVWSTLFTKSIAAEEPALFDVSSSGLSFSAGDTFVIEAQGNNTGAELRGSYVHPLVGPPLYPEELYLNGPTCYDNCGWRIGFQTWMLRAADEVVRLGNPPNPNALSPGLTSGPVSGAVWDPWIDHASFAPAATLDLLVVGVAPGAVDIPTPFGTLLCDLSLPPLVFGSVPGAPFGVPIPSDPSILGWQLCTQGLSIDGGTLALTNALDITIGAL